MDFTVNRRYRYDNIVQGIWSVRCLSSKGITCIKVDLAMSLTFCRKNTNCSIDESFERFAPVIEAAQRHGIRVRGYISTVIACPGSTLVPQRNPGEKATSAS